MSTNHNRIKVSDLETDDPDKILVTNSNGELEFIATKNIKVDSYNALDYDQEGKALDARQGKILKDLINNKTDKGGFQGTAQDLANSIPDLNATNLNLGGYPNTRNDGQLPTNKILSTDANGNLRLYTMAISQAPYINKLVPGSYLPEYTGNIRILGDFFTPEMCDRLKNPNAIILGGVNVIHYASFISSQELLVNVTTGSTEGSFSVTLNNGISATFPNALLIILGDVYSPEQSRWELVSGNPDLSLAGAFNITVHNSIAQGTYAKSLDFTKNFSLRFKIGRSPLGPGSGLGYQFPQIYIANTNVMFAIAPTGNVGGENIVMSFSTQTNWNENLLGNTICQTADEQRMFYESKNLEWRFISGIMYLYQNNILIKTYPDVVSGNLKLTIRSKWWDFINIKYIEL